MSDKLAFIRADMDSPRDSNLPVTLRTTGSPADALNVCLG